MSGRCAHWGCCLAQPGRQQVATTVQCRGAPCPLTPARIRSAPLALALAPAGPQVVCGVSVSYCCSIAPSSQAGLSQSLTASITQPPRDWRERWQQRHDVAVEARAAAGSGEGGAGGAGGSGGAAGDGAQGGGEVEVEAEGEDSSSGPGGGEEGQNGGQQEALSRGAVAGIGEGAWVVACMHLRTSCTCSAPACPQVHAATHMH